MRTLPAAADWNRRLHAARLRSIELEPVEYGHELRCAWLIWSHRLPWRWLPEPAALWVFSLVGGRFATRWIGARRPS